MAKSIRIAIVLEATPHVPTPLEEERRGEIRIAVSKQPWHDGSSMGVRVTSLRWIARNPVSARLRTKDGERRTEERGVPDDSREERERERERRA